MLKLLESTVWVLGWIGLGLFAILILAVISGLIWVVFTGGFMLHRALAVGRRLGLEQRRPPLLHHVGNVFKVAFQFDELQVQHVIIPRSPFKRVKLAPR